MTQNGAVVMGAERGIGSAGPEVAAEGHRVMLTDLDRECAELASATVAGGAIGLH